MRLIIFTTIILSAKEIVPSHGWTATASINNYSPFKTTRRIPSQIKGTLLEEPDNQFGRMTYWDESYRNSLTENTNNNDTHDDNDNGHNANNNNGTETFSWYCTWQDELQPFFTELIPLENNPSILVPGIGNDACIREMFDWGYHHLTAFDYAPEGVECAKRMFGRERLELMDDLRVADARFLPYENAAYDAVFDKGTFDSIYLSGGKDKELARKHLGMAIEELARVVKVGGIVFSVTAACVDAVQLSFDECNERMGCWKQIRDGSFYMTEEDGYSSNNVDATMLVWERI